MRSLTLMRTGMSALMALTVGGGSDRDLAVTATGSTSQANSYAIVGALTEVTTCALGNGVRLPTEVMNGDTFMISNKGASPCLLYPPTGGTVNLQAANASVTIAPGGVAIVKALTNLNFIATGVTSAGSAPVAAGATLSLTVAAHNGKTILLDTAAGSVVTLPAATGSMAMFRFVVSVLATSNSHIVKVANASDTMQGIIDGTRVDSGNAELGFAAQASSDTITLNRTTTGSVTLGEYFEVQDIAVNKWQVNGKLSATGAAFATPFSATV